MGKINFGMFDEEGDVVSGDTTTTTRQKPDLPQPDLTGDATTGSEDTTTTTQKEQVGNESATTPQRPHTQPRQKFNIPTGEQFKQWVIDEPELYDPVLKNLVRRVLDAGSDSHTTYNVVKAVLNGLRAKKEHVDQR